MKQLPRLQTTAEREDARLRVELDQGRVRSDAALVHVQMMPPLQAHHASAQHFHALVLQFPRPEIDAPVGGEKRNTGARHPPQEGLARCVGDFERRQRLGKAAA